MASRNPDGSYRHRNILVQVDTRFWESLDDYCYRRRIPKAHWLRRVLEEALSRDASPERPFATTSDPS
jgi:hypothetical protein